MMSKRKKEKKKENNNNSAEMSYSSYKRVFFDHIAANNKLNITIQNLHICNTSIAFSSSHCFC